MLCWQASQPVSGESRQAILAGASGKAGKPCSRRSRDTCQETAAGKETYLSAMPLSRYRRCMMIVCANSKGGVGKSTIATHLAVWLYDQGFQIGVTRHRQTAFKFCNGSSRQSHKSQFGSLIPRRVPLKRPRIGSVSHDFVVGDAPGGLEDLSRTLLILADLAIFPISPSILDVGPSPGQRPSYGMRKESTAAGPKADLFSTK